MFGLNKTFLSSKIYCIQNQNHIVDFGYDDNFKTKVIRPKCYIKIKKRIFQTYNVVKYILFIQIHYSYMPFNTF